MAFFQNGQPVTNTTGDIVSKINKESIKALTDGDDTNVSSADEFLILDAETDEVLRVTVGELNASGQLGSGSIASLNDIGDVNTPSPSAMDVLMWNGTEWVSGIAPYDIGLRYKRSNDAEPLDGDFFILFNAFKINLVDINGTSQSNFLNSLSVEKEYEILIPHSQGTFRFVVNGFASIGTNPDTIQFSSNGDITSSGQVPPIGEEVSVFFGQVPDPFNTLGGRITRGTVSNQSERVEIDSIDFNKSVEFAVGGVYEFSTTPFKVTGRSSSNSTGSVEINAPIESNLTVTAGNVISGDGSGLTNLLGGAITGTASSVTVAADLYVTGSVDSNTTSDERWKTINGPMSLGLDFLEKIQPISYQLMVPKEEPTIDPATGLKQWNINGEWVEKDGKTRYGYSAQEILSVEDQLGLPHVIASNANPDRYTITMDYMQPILVNSVKELKAEIEALKAEIKELKEN